MQQKEISLTDWHRIFAGNTPWMFLVEVLIRGIFTYVLLLIAMRLLGKRVAAQLSLFELSMVVTLAAAVGIPLQVPDRGLLPPIVILAVVILLQRCISRLGLNHRLVERLTAGDEAVLMQDGRLLLDNLKDSVLSREKLFGVLRGQEIQHLGQVERVYLESSGDFTILRAREPSPGLSLIPAIDSELRGKSVVSGHYVCTRCGFLDVSEQLPGTRCTHCDSSDWTEAVTELEDEQGS